MMINLKINRKGDERVLSMYWFILFIIVAVAIVSAVLIFYSYLLDVRSTEAGVLSDRVADCLSDNGILNEGKLDEAVNNIEGACNLILKDESKEKYSSMKSQYYIKVEANGKLIESGDRDFLAYCGQSSKVNIPVCFEKKLFVLNGNDFVPIKITTVVRKVEQNAKG